MADCTCGHVEAAHTEPAIFPPCEGTAWPPRRVQAAGFWAKGFHDESPACPCEAYEEAR